MQIPQLKKAKNSEGSWEIAYLHIMKLIKDLVRRSKQTKITAFLSKKEDTQNLTTEKNSESKDDIQPKKRSRLIILRSDKENC